MTEYRANLRIETFDDVDRIAKQAKRSRKATASPVHNNNANASWAAKALAAYADVIGRDVIETAISDLLGDLMHFVDAAQAHFTEGDDFDSLLETARWRYTEELGGEL